ncbi:hypothetical protein, partial [Clostridioides difficile]|uniref:hypothetical protein n=1 Tax=Clostridioides difficile TaxID=1496 RepID=UPI002E8E2635
MNNQISNGSLKEGVSQIAQSFGNLTSTIIKITTKALPTMIKSLSWVLKNGRIIATILISIKAAMMWASAVKTIRNMKLSFLIAKAAVINFKNGTAAAGTALTIYQSIVAVLTGEMTLATVATNGLKAAMVALGGPIGVALLAITALVAGLVVLWNTNKGFRDFVIGAWNSIKETATKVWGGICNFFTQTIPQAWESLCTSFSNAGQWFGEMWNNIKQAFVNGWNAIVAFFTQTIPMWINNIGVWFGQLPAKIGYGLGFALGKIISWGISVWTYLVTNV